MDDEPKVCSFCKAREAVGTLSFAMVTTGGMPVTVTWGICTVCAAEKGDMMRAAVEADDDPDWKFTLTEGERTEVDR